MKAKLIKTDSNYYLYVDGKIIASTEYVEGNQKLFKQNCDEIFGVVDVIDVVYKQVRNGFDGVIDSFTEAFAKECINKAIELNKDKVFTLEDVRKAYMDGVSNGHNFGYPAIDHTDKYIQSLQQPTEIDVEIKMEPCFYDQSLGGFSTSYTEDKPKEQPKLDENGCLILKKA
jgi:hypothetical protein